MATVTATETFRGARWGIPVVCVAAAPWRSAVGVQPMRGIQISARPAITLEASAGWLLNEDGSRILLEHGGDIVLYGFPAAEWRSLERAAAWPR
jgi:hypothetical protein